MMASGHNFLSNINSGQCPLSLSLSPLSLSLFDDKRPVFLGSTKEKGRQKNDDQKRKTNTEILALKTKQD